MKRLVLLGLMLPALFSCRNPLESEGIHAWAARAIGREIPDTASIVENINGYSGNALPLPGGMTDGYYRVVFQFGTKQHQRFETDIAMSGVSGSKGTWKALPVSESVSHVSGFLQTGPFKSGNPLEVKNGYYLFIDRHTSSHSSGTVWHERAGKNFTFAVYDVDTQKLYVSLDDT